MSICRKCGQSIPEQIHFCPNCGADVAFDTAEDSDAEHGQDSQRERPLFHRNDKTNEFTETDITWPHRILCALAYFPPLFFLPLLLDRKSPFCRFHSNQALVSNLLFLACGVAFGILTVTLAILTFGLILMFYRLILLLQIVCYLACVVLAVVGGISALCGKAKELPFVGRVRFFQ